MLNAVQNVNIIITLVTAKYGTRSNIKL